MYKKEREHEEVEKNKEKGERKYIQMYKKDREHDWT